MIIAVIVIVVLVLLVAVIGGRSLRTSRSRRDGTGSVGLGFSWVTPTSTPRSETATKAAKNAPVDPAPLETPAAGGSVAEPR